MNDRAPNPPERSGGLNEVESEDTLRDRVVRIRDELRTKGSSTGAIYGSGLLEAADKLDAALDEAPEEADSQTLRPSGLRGVETTNRGSE